MISGAPRYDGHSEWYDQTFSVFHPAREELAFLAQALGTGNGQVCIDLACGTGLCARPIADTSYRSAGFDISGDQLRFARRRLGAVARADACFLPVRDESVSVVVGMFFHTDLEDFAVPCKSSLEEASCFHGTSASLPRSDAPALRLLLRIRARRPAARWPRSMRATA